MHIVERPCGGLPRETLGQRPSRPTSESDLHSMQLATCSISYIPRYNRWKKGNLTVMKLWSVRRCTVSLLLSATTAMCYAQWINREDEVPAYHPTAPLKVNSLPPILSGNKLTGDNFRFQWQVHAYQNAVKIPNVLYQLPCYCRCDISLGHTSLRSCFEGLHGAQCTNCAKEALFAYKETQLGLKPAQIRELITRHEYEKISLKDQ